MRLGIVVTHPVQYQAPWFRKLAARPGLEIEVLFGHRASPREQADAGFGVEFEWDEPLLAGYPHRFLRNTAAEPSVNRFAGVDCPEVGEAIRAGRFDAVIVSGWHSALYVRAILACWNQRVPVMARSDSHSRAARGGWRRAAKALLYRALLPRLDACLAVGSWSREYFLEYGVAADRVFEVPHMVSPRFSPPDSRPEAPPVFLFAGKLTEWKRPLDFLDAARQARVRAVVAGDGPLRGACEAFAREHRLPVTFTGFLNQSAMIEAYRRASALVVPSRETWGLVVNEAMACGLPVIASDAVGSHPDLIRFGRTGFVYPHGDTAALAKLLEADGDALAAMGEAARRSVESAGSRAVEGVIEAMHRARKPVEVFA